MYERHSQCDCKFKILALRILVYHSYHPYFESFAAKGIATDSEQRFWQVSWLTVALGSGTLSYIVNGLWLLA